MRHINPISRPVSADKTFAVFTPIQILYNFLNKLTQFVGKIAFPQPEI